MVGAIAVVLALGFGIFAGFEVATAGKDAEIGVLEDRISGVNLDLARAYIKLIGLHIEVLQYKVVILSWDVLASHYTEKSSGKTMANGRPFDEDLLTAAHRILEFGTIVLLENPRNGRLCPAMITDRGPDPKTGRSLDVSLAVARELDIVEEGEAQLRCYMLVRGWPSDQDQTRKEKK